MRHVGSRSVREFARTIGYEYGALRPVLGDRGTKPGLLLLAAIARNTGVSAHWLLTGEGPMWRGETGDVEAVREELGTQVERWRAVAEERAERITSLEHQLEQAWRTTGLALQRAPAQGVAEEGALVLDGQPLSEQELTIIRNYRQAPESTREMAHGLLGDPEQR